MPATHEIADSPSHTNANLGVHETGSSSNALSSFREPPHSGAIDLALTEKLAMLEKIEGAQLSKSQLPTAIIVGAMLALLPHAANAQATGNTKVTYCGIGLQGALTDYTMANPYSGQFYSNTQLRSALAKALFDGIPAAAWALDIQPAGEGKGTGLALSHVITYEKSDQQSFVDPVDRKTYYNTSYAVGFNTVLFDLDSKQVRSLVPAILRYNTTTAEKPTNAARQQAFEAMLRNTAADAPLGQWMTSIRALPMRFDDKVTFQVLPVAFSEAAQQRLMSQNAFDAKSAADFSRRATILTEALVALQFAKPLVPADTGPTPAGQQSEPANNYVATIPECLGQSAATFTALPPAYQLRVIVDDLKSADFKHPLQTMDGNGTTQNEIGYGGRFKAQILAFDTAGGGTVIDDRTFGYAKSLRFLGQVTLDQKEEYLKLTSSFVKELLMAYSNQDKNWVKEHMSATIIDKKERNHSQVAKQWKDLFAKRLAIATVK